MNWYVLGFDGERGDRIVNALTNIGMFDDAAYVQAAHHVSADKAAAFVPGGEPREHDGKAWPMPRPGIPMRYVHAAMRLPHPLRVLAVRVLGRVYR